MRKKKKENNFGDLGVFGFGAVPLVNNSSTHKILEHFNRGLKLGQVRDEDNTNTAIIQDSLF